MIRSAAIQIFGEVQGVFFRAFVKERADELGLSGWARNAAGGIVEIVAEGKEENLKKLIEYCKEGPKFAKVDRVEVKWIEAEGKLKTFEIK
ncbi:MAG: acylphosphatase [bacterium]